MKILICGVGSVGERHIKNLTSLGYKDIILYRERNLPLRTIDYQLPIYTELDRALNQQPDIAFICNPTHLHMETAIRCAEKKCHLFIEKPISDTINFQAELKNLLKKNSRIAMVGYMMRYHPCILKMKEWVNQEKIGRVVNFRATWGEYLPDWHPWEDYRGTYAALKDMGGGPALTLSHELDIPLWLFGKVEKVVGISNFNSDLELTVEHGIDILIGFKNGVTANVHLDYIQKPPKRITEIVGTKGRIEFDYYSNQTILYTHNNPEGEKFVLDDSFDRNDLFVFELKDFLDSIKDRRPSPISTEEAFKSVQVVHQALRN